MRKIMLLASCVALLALVLVAAPAIAGDFDFVDNDDRDTGFFNGHDDHDTGFFNGHDDHDFADNVNDFLGEEDEEDIDFENVDGCTAVIEAEELDALLCPVTDIFGNETLEEVNV